MENNSDLGALRRWFRRLSLRAWLATGMGMALLPLVVLSIAGYVTYREKLAEPFLEVVNAQHRVLVPLERISNELWEISASVSGFAVDGNETYRNAFEANERDVARHLSELEDAVRDYDRFQPILDGVEQQWSTLIQAAGSIKSGDASLTDPALLRFENVIAETAKRLGNIAEVVRLESEKSHVAALAAIKQLELFATIAASLAVLFAALGVYVIDRALIASTDKLAAGALRIAAGDREREIDVQVPPELASVANAFNLMAKQIIRQENALSAAARTDGLTGLFNRREFDRVLAERIQQADETGTKFALLMLDVDLFKAFNDTYGHVAGDEALREIAKIVSDVSRESDSAFRYGGEEFAIIMPAVTAGSAVAAGERVRKAVEEHRVTLPTGEPYAITISVGVSVYGSTNSNLEVLDLADQALYQAKTGGRNMVRMSH